MLSTRPGAKYTQAIIVIIHHLHKVLTYTAIGVCQRPLFAESLITFFKIENTITP